MTNFAASILQNLSMAGTGRANYARQCIAEFDRNNDGTVSATEFQHVFASLTRIEEMTAGTTTHFVSSGCRPTLFEATMFPSYSNAYAASCYQATAMLDQLDTNGDQNVSLDEWTGDSAKPPDGPPQPDPVNQDPAPEPPTTPDPPAPPAPPTPPTPDERATELLAAYDTTGKGYITIDDVVNKWLADPSLGNLADAGTAIEAWDANGDGKVTRDDIVSAYQIMDAADSLLSALGHGDRAQIDLSALPQDKLAALDMTEQQLTDWDADKNGVLGRNEVVDGLKRMQIDSAKEAETTAFAQLLAKFDRNGNGTLEINEFAGALGTLTLDDAALQNIFAAWDASGDHAIDTSELQTGYQAIKDAQATVAAYDKDGKGYFDAADLQRAIDENGSTAEQATAHDILAAWDRDGDGKVSVQDVILMKQAMAQAAAAAATDQAQPA